MNFLNVFACLVFATSNLAGGKPNMVYNSTEEFTAEMPQSCEDQFYCFDNANYPDQIVKGLLADLKNLEVAKDDDEQLEPRQGYGQNGCSSTKTTDPIYYIVDEEDNVRVVVQMKGRFEQRFTVRWCKNKIPNGDSSIYMKSTVDKLNMHCENKTMNYEFLVLSKEPTITGEYQMERANAKGGIPVCCSCRYNKPK